ncbi:hypothetical protein IT568_12390, partial [bacterium]|nr:hypothetical protein [bacterium]
ESISVFGNTPFGVWSDDGATVSFSNSTAGSSGSERWKINDNLTDYSLGAISSGGNLYGVTYYDQILATVTLNGTSPTNTTDIVERAYYGGTLIENGLSNSWSGFVNKGTNLSFSGTTSQGWVTSDATTFNSLVPFSETITYVQSGSPPESLTIQKVGNDAVLNWNAVTGTATYKIYGNTNPDFVPTVSDLLGSSVTTSFTHTNGISSNTLFFYKVTAVTASAVSKKATETEK